jgi:DNA-binding NarL/FixJ family response regulator
MRGRTNREIADELTLSELTISRHLERIFVKLDVRSRTAAASYALRSGLACESGLGLQQRR